MGEQRGGMGGARHGNGVADVGSSVRRGGVKEGAARTGA
jgi:hypothetical protein